MTSVVCKPIIEQKPIVTQISTVDHCEYATGSVLIDAEPERIWNILVDYDNAPAIFTNLKSCHVEGRKGEAKLIRQIVEPSKFLKLDYVVVLTEKKPASIKWYRESGSLKEVKGTWDLVPVEDGKKTRVSYSIHLDGGPMLPAWFLTRQAKGYLPTMLAALKKRVESETAAG